MGPVTWGQHGGHTMGRMWPLVQSHATQPLLESSTLAFQQEHITGSGWVQPAVPTAGASSARWGHWDLEKQIKIVFHWSSAIEALRKGISSLSFLRCMPAQALDQSLEGGCTSKIPVLSSIIAYTY